MRTGPENTRLRIQLQHMKKLLLLFFKWKKEKLFEERIFLSTVIPDFIAL